MGQNAAFRGAVAGGSGMNRVNKSAVVPFSAEQMYELVNDVEDYPHFIPGCTGARILERAERRLSASLHWAKGPARVALTTANEMDPGRSILIRMVSGPFKRFSALWKFEPLTEQSCRVSFELSLETQRGLVAMLMGKAFGEIGGSMLDAFVQRARQRYGLRGGGAG